MLILKNATKHKHKKEIWHARACTVSRDTFRKKSLEATLPLLGKGDSWHLYRHCMSEQTRCNFLFYYGSISGYCLDLPPQLPLKSLQGEKGLFSANSMQKLSTLSWFLKKPFSPGYRPESIPSTTKTLTQDQVGDHLVLTCTPLTQSNREHVWTLEITWSFPLEDALWGGFCLFVSLIDFFFKRKEKTIYFWKILWCCGSALAFNKFWVIGFSGFSGTAGWIGGLHGLKILFQAWWFYESMTLKHLPNNPVHQVAWFAIWKEDCFDEVLIAWIPHLIC